MSDLVFYLITSLMYAALAVYFWRTRWVTAGATAVAHTGTRTLEHVLVLAPLLLHAALLYDSVGAWLISLYGYGDKVEAFREAYAQWGAWIILLKGLTPIPYKVVTITSGFAGYNLGLFLLFSIITRGARFFVLAFLLHRYGDRARHIIEKRLGLWVTLGAAVIIAGIVAALYLI